jgi:hypothetical protein
MIIRERILNLSLQQNKFGRMKKAIGKTSKGKKVEYEVGSDGWVGCYTKDLVELEIPEGCKYVSCEDNQLTELKLPEGCKYVSCEDNQLTELKLPEGCKYVWCWNNQIKTLNLPNSMEIVWCDLGLINLNDYKGKDIDFEFIIK